MEKFYDNKNVFLFQSGARQLFWAAAQVPLAKLIRGGETERRGKGAAGVGGGLHCTPLSPSL